ncbi:MAG: exodeoxyribonuclease III [Polyangiaceae bacterium]
MKLVSWNVNGLRSVLKRGLVDYLDEEKPDVLCLQETRCEATDVPPFWPKAHRIYFNTATKRGYAGTAILTKREPLSVSMGIGIPEHDDEGRVLTAEYERFFVVNVYVPNSKRDLSRLTYRQRWDVDFLRYLKRLERKKPVVFCGDLNVAHTELDLHSPQSQRKKSRVYPGRASRLRRSRQSRLHRHIS